MELRRRVRSFVETQDVDARRGGARGGDGGDVAGAVAVRGERAEVIRTGRDGPYRRSWHMNRRVVPGAARHAPAFQGAVAALSENPSGGRVIRTRRVIPARREHADGEDAGGGDVRGEHPSGAAEREVPGDHVAVAIAAEVGRRGERVSAGPGGRNVVGCATKGGRRGMRADAAYPERRQSTPSTVANETHWTSAPWPRRTIGSGGGLPIATTALARALPCGAPTASATRKRRGFVARAVVIASARVVID